MTEKEITKTMDSSRNLFVTGPAGTGKSYLMNQYIEAHENTLVCAPTGIAALTLDGDTMHRLFHIPVPSYETPSFAKGNNKAVPRATIRMLSLADTVIIDEVGMARADTFRYAVKVLRKAEKEKGSKIRVIVCGDFSQLPPVVLKGDEKLLKKFGLDPSGFAFTTAEWKSLNFKVLELEQVYRQTDAEFISHLAAIRKGDFSCLSYFEQFVRSPKYEKDMVYICGTNAEASRMNTAYLESLPGKMEAYFATMSGRCPAGVVEDVLLLKTGARVVFTCNDVRQGQYKNGSLGTVLSVTPEQAIVETDGRTVCVKPVEKKVNTYSATGGVLSKKEIGSAWQLPLKLAKAITVHRSQGQTFDCVMVNPDVFAPGQLYVALSRVRSPEGLYLTRPLTKEDLILDPVVQKFYKNGYTWEVKKPAAKTVKQSGAVKKTTKLASKSGTTKRKTVTVKTTKGRSKKK